MRATFLSASLCVLVLGALSACSNEAPPAAPPTAPAPPLATQQPEEISEKLIATGDLIAGDGQDISGQVQIFAAEPLPGAPETEVNAVVAFSNLSIPYQHVVVGGALDAKAQESCFDLGLRASGGQISPDQHGAVETTMPFVLLGQTVQEIVLHLDYTQVEESAECRQPVVARAVLNWQQD